MALYEGIALIQEKQAVVLDLGYDYIKCGFSGEPAPRVVLRSEFWTEQGQRRLHDYSDERQLYDNLVHMLRLLYFRYVLVNPKERRVVIVESLLTPTLFRETLAAVLYDHYEVASVVWADSARLSAMTLPAQVSLVVDMGARDAEIVPVVHGCVVLEAVTQCAAGGARTLHHELLRLLREDEPALPALDKQALEDIVARVCVVIDAARASRWAAGTVTATETRGVRWEGAGGVRVFVGGRTRELAAEIMFMDDMEDSSLPQAILRAISLSPLEARAELTRCVLLCGGGASLPGLRARLRHELRLRAPPATLAPRRAPPALCAWSGGALLGSAGSGDAAARRAVTREAWQRTRHVPDWASLLDNTPPDHTTRRAA